MFLPTDQNNPFEKEKSEFIGPLSLLHSSTVKQKEILVSLRNNKKMLGKIVAYDRHYNLMMVNTKEISVISNKNRGKKKKEGKEVIKNIGNVFIRGDSVILIASNDKI